MLYHLSYTQALILGIFKYMPWFLQWLTNHSKMYCSISMYLCSFSWYWFLVLFHYSLLTYKKQFKNFLYLLKLALWPKIWFLLEKVHGLLMRMCALWLLDGTFSRCLLSPFFVWCSLALKFLCWFVWIIYWWEWGIKVTHYCCIWTYVSLYIQ
jgi:hypothetical protein